MSEGLFNTASKPSGFNLIKINDNSPRTNIGTGEPDYFRVRNLSPSNKVDLYGGVGTDIVDLNNIGNLNSSDRGIINIALGAGGNNDGTSEINNIKVGDNVFNTTLKINGNFSRDQIELQGNPEDYKVRENKFGNKVLYNEKTGVRLNFLGVDPSQEQLTFRGSGETKSLDEVFNTTPTVRDDSPDGQFA